MKPALSSELTSGVAAGLAFFPLIIAIAVIAFGPLGQDVAAAMAVPVLVANLVGGALTAALARCPLTVTLSSGSSALVMAGLFAGLVAQGPTPGIAEAMAITASVVIVAGLTQLILVKAGAATLGPLAPYPVIAGLVNGTAALILLSQLPAARAHPWELVVALATTLVMLKFPPRWKIPAILPAILAGVIVHAALERIGLPAGPSLAAMPSPLGYPAMMLDAFTTWAVDPARLPWKAIVIAGITIALLGVLETLATFSALSDLGAPTREREDLRSIGIGNLLVGAMTAGPPISAPVGGGVVLWRLGGRGRLAVVTRLLTFGLSAALLGGYLPWIPEGVIVGLVIAIGLRLFDRDPAHLLWRAARGRGPNRLEIIGSTVVSFVVVAVAVFAGLAVAVSVGAIACLLIFTAAMAGNAVRRIYDGAATLSRVRHSADETTVLLRERRKIAVLELGGPLFFGNISPLGQALDTALESGARHIVIDLGRIVRVDMSGARRLISIVEQRRGRGANIVLAPIRVGHPVADYLLALGLRPGACYDDVTDALAAAEAAVLADAGQNTPRFTTAEDALRALGVTEEYATDLAARAEVIELETGDVVCRAGEAADSLLVLMSGQVDVRLRPDPNAPPVTLAHLRAGTVIGERALFEASVRTADVVCAEPSRALIFSGPALAALPRESPAAAFALVVAVTRNTSISLRQANTVIQRLEV
jgi:SulP family sulfate permease